MLQNISLHTHTHKRHVCRNSQFSRSDVKANKTCFAEVVQSNLITKTMSNQKIKLFWNHIHYLLT